jgi:hypothetical protein
MKERKKKEKKFLDREEQTSIKDRFDRHLGLISG